jgi:hypothetical protein
VSLTDRITAAIVGNDLDDLLRCVDVCVDARDWEVLMQLRDRARNAAFDTGRQMWPAANYAEYRLALDAPAEYAAAVLVVNAGSFTLGPLSEVAAQSHTWAELAPHAAPGPIAALTAHERVVRREVVDPETVAHAEVLGVPLELQAWEPPYLLPVYHADHIEATGPDPLYGRAIEPGDHDAPSIHDPDVVDAFRDVVRPWTAHSEGSARVVAVEGNVGDALAVARINNARGAFVDAGEALARIAWAGSSGGRHGRRRGVATGRDLAWAAAGALAGFEPGERVEPSTLGDAISNLRWLVWNAPDASTGWQLRLAVEDPVDGIAWLVDAVDRGERDG